jgi:clan AA aspartic protease (TIGR02281 family)
MSFSYARPIWICLVFGLFSATLQAADPKPTPDKGAGEKTADKGAAASPTDEPEAFLKEKGLIRVDPFFVLKDESKITTQIHGLDKLQHKAFEGQKQENLAEKGIEQMKAQIEEYHKQRITLHEQIPRAVTVDQHNALVLQSNNLLERIDVLQAEIDKGAGSKKTRDAAAQAKEDYVDALLQIRRAITKLQGSYADLAADSKVTEAIEAYNKLKNKQTKLGPTAVFAMNERKLKKFEDTVLSDAIDIHRGQGQLWEVSVVFNGGTTPQILEVDTGASYIALSYAVAKAAGLTPSPEDPTIHMQLADGSVIAAKKVTASSVRVGKFIVEKVPVAVMPIELKDAGNMLGQSFLKHFTYKIDTEKEKLVMTKIEAATPAAGGAKAGKQEQ